jgi:hypothetical protein
MKTFVEQWNNCVNKKRNLAVTTYSKTYKSLITKTIELNLETITYAGISSVTTKKIIQIITFISIQMTITVKIIETLRIPASIHHVRALTFHKSKRDKTRIMFPAILFYFPTIISWQELKESQVKG